MRSAIKKRQSKMRNMRRIMNTANRGPRSQKQLKKNFRDNDQDESDQALEKFPQGIMTQIE